jgi:hypothetical protein
MKHRTIVVVALLFLVGCRFEDRSPKPTGVWHQIVDETTADGIDVAVWETDSNTEGRSCLNVQVDPEPSARLPRREEPELYKGKKAACLPLPAAEDPVNVLLLAESDRYGIVIAAVPEGTSATLVLAGGDRVANALGDDDSPTLNIFVGTYGSVGRAASLDLNGPEGSTVCRFDNSKPSPDPVCSDAG